MIIILSKKWEYYNILPEEHPWGIDIWGDPELGFVWYIDSTGEINAKQKLMTWYGWENGKLWIIGVLS